MAQKDKNTHIIYNDSARGMALIGDEVINTIAALAATEVEGVSSIAGGITFEKAARAGGTALSKGVRTEITDDTISVRLIIIVKYDYSIPDVTMKVQERVKSALETMTGFRVKEVNVSVADVQVETSAG